MAILLSLVMQDIRKCLDNKTEWSEERNEFLRRVRQGLFHQVRQFRWQGRLLDQKSPWKSFLYWHFQSLFKALEESTTFRDLPLRTSHNHTLICQQGTSGNFRNDRLKLQWRHTRWLPKSPGQRLFTVIFLYCFHDEDELKCFHHNHTSCDPKTVPSVNTSWWNVNIVFVKLISQKSFGDVLKKGQWKTSFHRTNKK